MTLLNTKNLFLLTVFCIPLYIIRLHFFGIPTNVLELLILLSVVATLYKKPEKKSFHFSCYPLFMIAIFLILSGLLSSFLFNDPSFVGLGIIKSWFLLPLFFGLALYFNVNSRKDFADVYLAMFYSISLTSIIAFGYKILHLVTYDNRLSAFYQSPNYLAMYLAPGVFLGLYFCQKNFKKNNVWFILYSLLLVIITLAIYFTYSYGAWLGICGSLLILLAFSVKRYKLLLIAGVLIACIAVFMLQFNTAKFSTYFHLSQRSSLASRITIWQVSKDLIIAHPFLGIGPGNFQKAYLAQQKNYPPYLEWAVPEPHNIFLAFWLQAGFLGLIGFILLLLHVFSLLRNFSKQKEAALAAPVLGFFVYVIIHGLVDTLYWKNDLAMFFWIYIFLIFTLIKISKKHTY